MFVFPGPDAHVAQQRETVLAPSAARVITIRRMCGRFELNARLPDLQEHFGDVVPPEAWREYVEFHSYNVAPSLKPPVVRYSKRASHNVIEPLAWGFRPQSAKRPWINARDDTLFTQPLFRASAQKRRCLVVATGWYEWRDVGEKKKQPYYVHLGHVFAFAGVWTARKLNETDWEATFAIITTAARGPELMKIHDRMPLVLPPKHYAAWLNPQTESPQSLLTPHVEGLRAWPVSTSVNDPRNDSAECVEEVSVS